MAIVKPFKGLLYNPSKIKHLANVMAPPYDVVSPAMQDALYNKDPRNIVRVILGKDEPSDNARCNKYIRAGKYLEGWIKDSVIRRDKKPAVYLYLQTYKVKEKAYRRYGFIALMKLDAGKKNKVMPHEHTFAKPKEDRLNLMRAVKANMSCIFALFDDKGNKVMSLLKSYAGKRPSIIDIAIDGVGHKLWSITEPAVIGRIARLMKDKGVIIADGHHRYETAVNFFGEMRRKEGRSAAKYGYAMMYFTGMADPGLAVLPTHRVLKDAGVREFGDIEKKVAPYFRVDRFDSAKEMLEHIGGLPGNCVFGVYFKGGKAALLWLKDKRAPLRAVKETRSSAWKSLDVTILHRFLFGHIMGFSDEKQGDENIIYTRDDDEAIALVDSGRCGAAFFMRPTKVREVKAVAEKGERMPHKSTYFYPKLLSGLVINKF